MRRSLLVPLCLRPGRDPEQLVSTRDYLKAVGMFRDYFDARQDPDFTQVGVQTHWDMQQ